ncbi:MAG: hypothetical protein OEW08_04250 [Gammaproteobacteria bacterium]|nr:hypothetical protein [Gammaproteobacteria bacterium]
MKKTARWLLLPCLMLITVVAMALDKEEAVRKASMALRELVHDADITVVRVEPKEWRNSSLGCPQPGMMYAQVMMSGFRVELKANGKLYDWRVSDHSARLCETNAKKSPPSPSKRMND